MIYAYARVSTKDQNEDRQLAELRQHVTDERYIIVDKASGKNFDRIGYNSLVGTENTLPLLREGDTLIIMSIDRLGRDYTEIKEQWAYITNTLKCNIKVLDMPLLDTSQNPKNLDSKFIADLTLQILSYVAEKERENIRKRQRQGIDTMPTDENGKRYSRKTGKSTGRPEIELTDGFVTVYNQWKNGEITAVKAREILGLKHTTFYHKVKQYEALQRHRNKQ